jgi:CRISPR system Cascade subunit CasE
MILSQFQLSMSCPEARRDLSNPYEMHRTFSTRLLSGKRGLWRLEDTNVLLLSDTQPDWSEVSTEYLRGTPRSKSYPVSELKLQGRRFYFRLKANPTKSIKEGRERKERGKRVQLVTDEHKQDWLLAQASRHGFSVSDFTCTPTKNLRFRKKKGQPEITLGFCTFEGVLTVDDVEKFRACLEEGLGRGKSFGMGLLSIAPA